MTSLEVFRVKRITVTAIAIVLFAFGWGARAVASSNENELRYKEIGGDGPNLIIRGECFTAEDVTTLRLVEWRGVDRPVTYRCVQP